MSIYPEMHNKYGNPYYVAEFRLFNLNDCYKNCESCFYKRAGNHLDNYQEIYQLALELKEKNYQLETCYLLPTDFFENHENYVLIERPEVSQILALFKYMGIASTMEGKIDFDRFQKIVQRLPIEQVELQINLINEKLFEEKYFQEVKGNIEALRSKLGEGIVFNLALNLGRDITDQEYERIQYFVSELSDDGILEINFTFLYNENFRQELKEKKLLSSLKSMRKLAKMYNKQESQFNDRTLLRKPSFIFKDNAVFLAPIIPFDEYAFVKSERFELENINFEGFLATLGRIEEINTPIIDECHTCEQITTCMGKAYLAAAHSYQLPCFLGV